MANKGKISIEGEKPEKDKELNELKKNFNKKELTAVHGEAIKVAQSRYARYSCIPGPWIIAIEKELMKGRLAAKEDKPDLPEPDELKDKEPSKSTSMAPDPEADKDEGKEAEENKTPSDN